jgi:SAM-dependent methyltransferase
MKMREVKTLLRDIYDSAVEKRERTPAPAWELEERDAFFRLLQRERTRSLLELGAATGADAAFFVEKGFDVVCIDLSPEMVRRCRNKGLTAHVMDVGDLRFEAGTFDAVYAKNCLVHVPKAELETALGAIARVLRPGGLFYLSMYGGREFEGVWEGDSWEPKRFFSFHTDESLRRAVTRSFEICSFERISEGFSGHHYQSLILRNRAASPEDHG